jgi:hypothetical protein
VQAGKLDDAVKQLDSALALAPAADSDLRSQLVACKAHFGALSGKAGKPDPKENAAAAARAVAQIVLTGKPAADAAKTQIAEAWSRADPDKAAPVAKVPALELALLAWAACVSGNRELAEALCSRIGSSQDARPRVWVDLTRAQLNFAASVATDNLSAASVRARLEALDAVEQCLRGFHKLHDVDGVHASSRVIWNVCLPLLQHNLRHHAKRAFTTAATALDASASPLHELRALLHLELAKCDAAEDLLAPAKQHTSAAHTLDYAGSPGQAAHFHLPRPLDRHIAPLLHSLTLRTSTLEAPVAGLEKARLSVERAREARSAAAKTSQLESAIAALRSVAAVQPPAQASTVQADVEAQHAARTQTELWADVTKAAYQGELYRLALEAAPSVAWFQWHAAVDREMVVLQVRCHCTMLICADTSF